MSAPLVLPARFDPAQTLDCGQAFRWRPVPGRACSGEDVGEQKTNGHSAYTQPCYTYSCEAPVCWEGAAGGRFLRLWKEGDRLVLSCTREEFDGFWRNYFDFDDDYEARRRALSALSPALAEAAAFAPGIRILRQDPWEALCSFLISQNNNIPRIKGIIHTLCSLYGEPIPGTQLRAFPTPEALAGLSPEDLAPLRAGYRAKYLIDAAVKTASGRLDLAEIARNPAGYGRGELMKVTGVGPKVAECVLLYGFHKTECFPIDVWMKRAMAVLLPGRSPEEFGGNAGLAQQYIFHYSRMNPQLFRQQT